MSVQIDGALASSVYILKSLRYQYQVNGIHVGIDAAGKKHLALTVDVCLSRGLGKYYVGPVGAVSQ